MPLVDVKFKNGTERKFGNNYYGANVKYEGAFVIVMDDGGQTKHAFPAEDVLEVIERSVR